MTSFQISISPSRRVAARFISGVRRALQKALAEEADESGLTQAEVARRVGVHRSVINRELRGVENLTLGRVAELAWAMGRTPFFDLPKATPASGSNHLPSSESTSQSALMAYIQESATASQQTQMDISSGPSGHIPVYAAVSDPSSVNSGGATSASSQSSLGAQQ